MAEESERPAPPPVERVTELAESRKGVFAHAEVGLPPGFEPPSAALAPTAPAAQVQAAANPNAAAGQDAPSEQ